MTINFYLNDESSKELASFNNLTSNPFKLDDIIGMEIRDLAPFNYKGFKKEIVDNMIESNNSLKSLVNRKNIKLVKELKWVNTTVLTDSQVTIDYYCDII